MATMSQPQSSSNLLRQTSGGQRLALFCCSLAAGLAAPCHHAYAQRAVGTPLLDSLLSAHSMVVELRDGTLQGPGADFILSNARDAQFVALGEDHNNREIPEVTSALFRALQTRVGYHYYVEEQDPDAMRRVSHAPLRGHLDSLVALARRYPDAFTFMSDQELQMLADISATSSAATDPVWGCDQSFGVANALDDLLDLPLTKPAKAAAAALRDTAKAREQERNLAGSHYIATEPTVGASLANLDRTVKPTPGSPADVLLQDLIISNRVYRNWIEGRRYQANYEREEYMKACFMRHYRRTESANHQAPRVLMKFGHNHLARGFGYTNLQTLGDFISQLAVANGGQSFHLAVLPNTSSGYGDLAAWADSTPKILASRALPSEWTVIDVRALRPVYDHLLQTPLSPVQAANLHRWVFGFDAVLLIGGSHAATYALNPGVKY